MQIHCGETGVEYWVSNPFDTTCAEVLTATRLEAPRDWTNSCMTFNGYSHYGNVLPTSQFSSNSHVNTSSKEAMVGEKYTFSDACGLPEGRIWISKGEKGFLWSIQWISSCTTLQYVVPFLVLFYWNSMDTISVSSNMGDWLQVKITMCSSPVLKCSQCKNKYWN